MNRRNFVKSFSILASAVTYPRTWKVIADSGLSVPEPFVLPSYEDAPFEIGFVDSIPGLGPRITAFPRGSLVTLPLGIKPCRAAIDPQGKVWFIPAPLRGI